ncbi:SPRY domain-containing SOCS box protein 2 [Pimephales promelas]|uniref:SPRY domain-containing SOCS box protein 2 n=1 Tax=Pimephales promelas TaxID=90988 RepID=UPI0019558C9C|nr:SPRY domain-containing SOCS box protein 2 [Pimephales promelas]XP_039508236.1 SPRY domain-containing SOCS box protein 2 [Pimephales promelas]XP_039508237.1 SPRY domain-containing SOCS box protein 2 [Pimephales promelas]KAG1960495.1 B30.2/SPRY domain-containing protein [Pimephales promelas]
MGLTLSCWLGDGHLKKHHRSSSAFSPFSVAPPIRLAVLLDTPPVAAGDPRSQWSRTHLSPNLQVCASGGSVCRARVEQSSDAVRGAVGVEAGLHIWEVRWEQLQRGSHALLGVSTHTCTLQASGYTALIGGDSCSWGWDLSTNQLWHDGKKRRRYPGGGASDNPSVPDRVLVVLDADAGTLGYVVDNCYLGVAFRDLPKGAELFPAVSCVWGGAQICIRYLGGTTRDAPALQALSRLSVRRTLESDGPRTLPPALQRLLLDL